MHKTVIALAVSVAVTGCAFFNSSETKVTAVNTPAEKSATADLPPAYEFRYYVLMREQTDLVQVFDDGHSTYLQFATEAPGDLMLFDPEGVAVTFDKYDRYAVVPGLFHGLLVRTFDGHSYAAPIDSRRPANVAASRVGESVPSVVEHLPPDLAALRAQILAAHHRLNNLSLQIDKVAAGAATESIGAVKQELDEIQTQVGGLQATLVRVRYESGDTMLALSPETKTAIVNAARVATRIDIRGRTDAAGTIEVNEKIAQARAENAKRFLVTKGISATAIHLSWLAKEDYVASNNTPDGRAQNRRVEFVMTP